MTRRRTIPPAEGLLPATHSHIGSIFIPQMPSHSLVGGGIGRGTVFWRIWPGVLFHCLFSAGVVAISLETKFVLAVPPVLLTVLGMIIGFVISYRAMTGYDRYWMGRSSWSDIIRNARTMARLVWHHVPPRYTPKVSSVAPEARESHMKMVKQQMRSVMAEKRMALDMIEGFAVAVKHHLRGEPGLYYEDLYYLVEPLHTHGRITGEDAGLPRSSRKKKDRSRPTSGSTPTTAVAGSYQAAHDVIPAVNSYGTFNATASTATNVDRSHSPSPSISSEPRDPISPLSGLPYSHSRQHLLQPSMAKQDTSRFSKISSGLVPFASTVTALFRWLAHPFRRPDDEPAEGDPNKPQDETAKHRPKVAGGIHAQNMPLEILRCLSEWVSVLEDRECCPGAATGGMLGCIANFEESLAALERILTTPLPFVYAVHIRHTVWVYLFFLPFQLLEQFGWYTIPGVAIAAFIYLGFLAAGEEIEQPFGYDENDLDLDLFCRVIIHEDLERLKKTPCFNSYAGPDKGISGTVADILREDPGEEDDGYYGWNH